MWWFIVGFVAIGLFAGAAMKNVWPEGIRESYRVMSLLGVAGSLVGGMLGLLEFSHGRSYDYRYGMGDVTRAQAERIVGPSSWISLIGAGMTAVIFIALYGLLSRRQE